MISGAVLAALFFLTNISARSTGTADVALKPGHIIQDGSMVSIEYTLTDESGKVIDSSAGKEPLTYIQGAGQIVRGLEQDLGFFAGGGKGAASRQTPSQIVAFCDRISLDARLRCEPDTV